MTIEQIYNLADKIGLLTFSTISDDGSEVHSRIAHLNGFDGEGIYFRTMGNKPYGRELKRWGKVTICGNSGGGIMNHDAVGAAPVFAPGYMFRLVGEIVFVEADMIAELSKSNKMLEVAARDILQYPAMASGNFKIVRAKGEIFDYDFDKINRDHKLLRRRFSFGGVECNAAGVRINGQMCVGCGACRAICSFDAIKVVDGRFQVMGERCDDCGSCLLRCPVGAIEESLVM